MGEGVEGWFVVMFGGGVGLRPAARTNLETVKDGSQACTQEGGKKKGGGRVSLGKSVGGGGRERRKRNCEIFQLVFFFLLPYVAQRFYNLFVLFLFVM